MEAKLVRFEVEQITESVGQIAVTATKEEWRQVIQSMVYLRDGDASGGLVNWLINQGVYE